MRKSSNALYVSILLCVCLILLPRVSNAAAVGAVEAKQVAQSWLSYIIDKDGNWGGTTQAYVSSLQELRSDGRLLGYKFSVHPTGYILVSTMTQLPPVKAFSTTSDIDVEASRGFAALLKDTITATLDYLEKDYGNLNQLPENGVAPQSNRDAWDWLLGKRDEPGADQDVMSGPLLVTDWDQEGLSELVESSPLQTGALLSSAWEQGSPYNAFCPLGFGGGRTLVGCVATAASQIMKYWQYPYEGTGSHRYTWSGDDSCAGTPTPGGTLSATFSDAYDWNNMLNSYSGAYNADQANAVRELCYEVGVAFDMDYGVCASGAYTADAVTVFPTYFKYAHTTDREDRDDYASAANWFAQVRKEFDNALPRPIQYRIQGHSIVCDGYRVSGGTNYYHMNYGWAGSRDNWYAVDNLYCPWSGCTYLVEFMVRGIQPKSRMYPIVRGTDNGIYEAWFDYLADPPTWRGSWAKKAGATTHAPASAGYRNVLYRAVVGTDQRIYIATKNGKGDETSWSWIGGYTIATPTMTAFDDKLYMAVTGTDNRLYTRYMSSSGTWSSWTAHNGWSNHAPALAALGDRLYLIVTGTDSRIYFRTLLDTGTWSAWYKLGAGSSPNGPAAVTWDDRVRIAVRGGDSGIYWTYLYYNYSSGNYRWQGSWSRISGLTSSTPALAVQPEGSNILYVMVRGTDNRIWWRWWDRIEAMWGGWNGMNGWTADSPSLHVSYYYIPTTGHYAFEGLPASLSGLQPVSEILPNGDASRTD